MKYAKWPTLSRTFADNRQQLTLRFLIAQHPTKQNKPKQAMSSKNTLVMRARVCDLTGKSPNRQARVITFSNQRNKTVQHVNLQWKRFFSEELDRKVRLRVSTKAIKTVTKLGGIDKAAKKYEIDLAKF
jgi:large subunit ribosomal protein L28